MAARLGLTDCKPFGEYHGDPIGVMGTLSAPTPVEDIAAALFPGYEDDCRVYPFGASRCQKIAIVSGGAGDMAAAAAAAGADLFVTGEVLHQHYHYIAENHLTVIAAGHYRSETVGVTLVADHLKTALGIDTFLVDIPTGL
jgi:putative NIF3 family GTP cyclohydrolase 1 type 2